MDGSWTRRRRRRRRILVILSSEIDNRPYIIKLNKYKSLFIHISHTADQVKGSRCYFGRSPCASVSKSRRSQPTTRPVHLLLTTTRLEKALDRPDGAS